MFTNEAGEPLTQARVTWALRRACRRAGVKVVSPYCLRHSCATALLEAGVHPKVVAERLGHGSTNMTLDVYSHVGKGLASSATEVLEGLFQGSRMQPGCDSGALPAAGSGPDSGSDG